MATKTPALRYTYEDYRTLPDDGKRHEIIRGKHYMAPAPGTNHQRVIRKLLVTLDSYSATSQQGEAFVSPVDVILSKENVVQPDVLFISESRKSIIKEHAVEGAPDLVVEVLSEGNRRYDEIVKRKLYAEYSVTEYWIVDPELETIKIYRHPEGGYERVAELSLEDEDVITTDLFSGFSLALTDIFS